VRVRGEDVSDEVARGGPPHRAGPAPQPCPATAWRGDNSALHRGPQGSGCPVDPGFLRLAYHAAAAVSSCATSVP
jgi:hypothetical protein